MSKYIGDRIVNPIGKFLVKFDDINLPSDEILNYEDENHDFHKISDYKNTNEDILNGDNDVKPLSLFTGDNFEVNSVFTLNHRNSKDTYHLCKDFKTRKTNNDSGEAINPKSAPTVK